MPEIKDLFRNSVGKIVTFFVEHTEMDYSISEIHRGTGISNRHLWRLLRHLEKQDVIVVNRKIGLASNIPMWKLKLHPTAIAMIRIQDSLKNHV